MTRDDTWAEILVARFPEKVYEGETPQRAHARLRQEAVRDSGLELSDLICGSVPFRLCFFCLTVKDHIQFTARTPMKCKECTVWVRKHRYYKNHDAVKIAMRVRLYNITADDLERMHTEQQGRCAICQQTAEEVCNGKRPLSIDHDHKSGRVRGLLCQRCNHGLGMFEDDPERLRKAIAYLQHQ